MDLNIVFYGREKNLEKVLLSLLSSDEECFLWVVTARTLKEKGGHVICTRRNVYRGYAMISGSSPIKLPLLSYPEEPPYVLSEEDMEKVESAEQLLFIQSGFLDTRVGDTVKVARGPLCGISGVVEKIEDTVVTITASLFGREIQLRTPIDCLVKV